MNLTPARTALAAAIALLGAACSNMQQSASSSPGTTSAVGSPSATSTSGTAAAAPRILSPGGMAQSDRTFMEQAAESGLAEVESSRLALSKSSSPQVKAFAQRMIDDHSKTNQELAGIAAAKGVKLPTALGPGVKAQLDKLAAAGDANSFDRSYVDQMGIAAHQDALRLFEQAARASADTDLRAFAAKTLPALQHHLQMAQQLKAALAG